MKKTVFIISLLTMALLLPGQAAAVLVTNVTTSQTIFQDDFETGTVGSMPDNGALPGDWGGTIASVEDAGSYPVPGPYDGLKYLRLLGTGTLANFTKQTSGTIRAEVMWYQPSGQGAWASAFALRSEDGVNIMAVSYLDYTPPGGPTQWWLYEAAHNVWLHNNMTFDAWHKIELEYTLSTFKGTVTFDGVPITYDFTDVTRARNNSVALRIGRDGPGAVFLDGLAASPPPTHNPGDVNDDDFVGGADLTQILTNWGMSGANWGDGDVAPYPGGDDFVGGADYTEVLTYWGTSYSPEAIPEPAALALMLIGSLGLLRRRS